MHDNEAIEMMRRCSREIKGLREEIARLQPKADAFDKMSIVLELLPRRSAGACEDVAYMLDRKVDQMVSAAKAVANPET